MALLEGVLNHKVPGQSLLENRFVPDDFVAAYLTLIGASRSERMLYKGIVSLCVYKTAPGVK